MEHNTPPGEAHLVCSCNKHSTEKNGAGEKELESPVLDEVTERGLLKTDRDCYSDGDDSADEEVNIGSHSVGLAHWQRWRLATT